MYSCLRLCHQGHIAVQCTMYTEVIKVHAIKVHEVGLIKVLKGNKSS